MIENNEKDFEKKNDKDVFNSSKVPVEIEGTLHKVYVLKRPFVDEFLEKMGELFECVLFTASLAKYADEVANEIDPKK